MTASVPAGWYPDPSGASRGPGGGAGLRWWDGAAWTEHVQQDETVPKPQSQGPPSQSSSLYLSESYPGQAGGFQSQGQPGHGYGDTSFEGNLHPAAPSGGYRSPLTEPTFFVSQKRKLIELTNEYAIFGQDGNQIGAVTEVGQSGAKKAIRFLTDFDQFLTHRLEVRDINGGPLMALTRPAKIFKSTLIVQRPDGTEIGRLVQRNMIGKIRFGLEAGGQEIGSLNAQNWRAWNFSIQDHTGSEVARITKTWEGLLTTLFTTADKYMVQIARPLTDPLLSLVVASALTVDTALKQDSRGWN